MRGVAPLGLALAAVAALARLPARAEPAEPPISAMADDLQRFQTRIAAGDKFAYPAETAELKAMAEAIAQREARDLG